MGSQWIVPRKKTVGLPPTRFDLDHSLAPVISQRRPHRCSAWVKPGGHELTPWCTKSEAYPPIRATANVRGLISRWSEPLAERGEVRACEPVCVRGWAMLTSVDCCSCSRNDRDLIGRHSGSLVSAWMIPFATKPQKPQQTVINARAR